jgi:hypothetical protein
MTCLMPYPVRRTFSLECAAIPHLLNPFGGASPPASYLAPRIVVIPAVQWGVWGRDAQGTLLSVSLYTSGGKCPDVSNVARESLKSESSSSQRM